MKRLVLLLGGLLLTLVAGCATSHNVNVAPIQVAPIRMTMDVNVNVHESDEDVAEASEEAGSGGEASVGPDAGVEDADAGAQARTERRARRATGG